jgi:hypothetical protein
MEKPWLAITRPAEGPASLQAGVGVSAFWRRQRHLLEGEAARHASPRTGRRRTAQLAASQILAIAVWWTQGLVRLLSVSVRHIR